MRIPIGLEPCYSLSSWERAGVRALRIRLRLLTKCFNPPPLALTLALSQRERELRGCLSQGERGQNKRLPPLPLRPLRLCVELTPLPTPLLTSL